MTNTLFTVIIPTFNRSEILNKCLDSLNKQTISANDMQVIVVDDGSNDSTEEIANNWSEIFTDFKYIKQENLGQGNARNNGLKHATGEIILFIGDDIILEENALEEHKKTHELHPELNSAVLGFTTWHPNIKTTPFMKWLTSGKKGGPQFAYDILEGKKTADYRFFYTSNISLKKTLIDNYNKEFRQSETTHNMAQGMPCVLALFDSDFKNYGWEDIELGYRLTKKENLKIHYNKLAIGYHYHEIDETSLEQRMISIGKSSLIFQKKHPELKIIPPTWKKIIFRAISLTPILLIAKKLNKNFYYYTVSKKFFLKGLSNAIISPEK